MTARSDDSATRDVHSWPRLSPPSGVVPSSAAVAPAAPASGCFILPPYLLERLASADDPAVALAGSRTLAVQATLRGIRATRSARSSGTAAGRPPHGFIPDTLLRRIPTEVRPDQPAPGAPSPITARRSIYDAGHRAQLPGVLRRREGQPPHVDESVNEAYDGLGATWRLLLEVYQRDSLDGRGLPLRASVHFERDYDNAFWDGEQMVFGDGDGVLFRSFTDAPDVIGHELAHGLTQYTAGLVYVGQSGALNESISDVFGVLTTQYLRQQLAGDADWLVGAGLFTERVHGVALRSMKAPGTAYDDPTLGKDPQPAHFAKYVKLPHDEAHDNGGVHINSGIPNHAFYLVATQLGGFAWERAGQIWFDTLTRGGLPKDANFVDFATATVTAARQRYGADGPEAESVAQAWSQVGVPVAQPTQPDTGSAPSPNPPDRLNPPDSSGPPDSSNPPDRNHG